MSGMFFARLTPRLQTGCERGGRVLRGLRVHGGIDVIPAGVNRRFEVA